MKTVRDVLGTLTIISGEPLLEATVVSNAEQATHPTTNRPTVAFDSRCIGDHEILDEIARGGMGVPDLGQPSAVCRRAVAATR